MWSLLCVYDLFVMRTRLEGCFPTFCLRGLSVLICPFRCLACFLVRLLSRLGFPKAGTAKLGRRLISQAASASGAMTSLLSIPTRCMTYGKIINPLLNREFGPVLKLLAHDPLDPHGNQTDTLDVSSQRHRDFIVYDTSQYVQLRTTRWAWTYCNLMILPVCPYAAQIPNYMEALQLYLALPAPRAPILVSALSRSRFEKLCAPKALGRFALFSRRAGMHCAAF